MCDVGRLHCFLSAAPVLCRVAVRYVDGGRDQSKEKTQGTWFCLFALAGPQRCMFSQICLMWWAVRKEGLEACTARLPFTAFTVYLFLCTSPVWGKRWNFAFTLEKYLVLVSAS